MSIMCEPFYSSQNRCFIRWPGSGWLSEVQTRDTNQQQPWKPEPTLARMTRRPPPLKPSLGQHRPLTAAAARYTSITTFAFYNQIA